MASGSRWQVARAKARANASAGAWLAGLTCLLLVGGGATGCTGTSAPADSPGGGGSGSGAGGRAGEPSTSGGVPQSGAGTGGTTSGGGSGAPSAGTAQGGTPSGGAAGSSGTGGAGGSPGPASCAGRALSLAANTTGSETDTAHALVAIDLQSDLPLGNVDRTIEFWMYVKPTDWVAEHNEIYVYGTVGMLQQVGLDFGAPAVQGMPGNHATLGPYTDGIYDDDTGVYLGLDSSATQWLHVAMTWDGANTTLRTYVNGALRITTKSVNSNPLITTASPFYLGCNPPYYGCFNGLVDELRIWSVRRSDAEIMSAYDKALSGNELGLVGYYKFDDAPGSLTAADSVTAGLHIPHPGMLMAATASGVPTFVTPDPLPNVACP